MRFSMFVSTILLVFLGSLRAEEAKPLDERIQTSITKGVQFLKQSEDGKGNWNTMNYYPGGPAGLVLLALLDSGISPKEAVIQRGLEKLRAEKNTQTYVVSIATVVFCRVGDPKDRVRILRNVEWLLEAQQSKGWGYTQKSPVADNSNTHFAMLALHHADRFGMKFDRNKLQRIESALLRGQRKDGGWHYRPGQPSTMTMTVAGVFGLLVVEQLLASERHRLQVDGISLNCGERPTSPYTDEKHPIARAIGWIGDRLPDHWTPKTIHKLGSPYYALHDFAQLGTLHGHRFLEGRDWYQRGCEYLVSTQRANGSWKLDVRNTKGMAHDPIISTAFALQFLAYGQRPVGITKFAHGLREDWSRKYHDLHNLVDFANREAFESSPIAWQNYDIRKLTTDDENIFRQEAVKQLLPSPVVFVSGHYLRMAKRESHILRDYLDRGGFLFAEACCGSSDFDEEFKLTMKTLFEKEKLELKPLPKDHPIWTGSGKFKITPNDPFPLLGIRRRGRWIAVYSPKPLAGYWEVNQFSEGRGKTAFELATNVLYFAHRQRAAKKK